MDAMTTVSAAPPVVANYNDQAVSAQPAPASVSAPQSSVVRPAVAVGEQGQAANQNPTVNEAGSQGPVDVQALHKAVDKVSHVVQLYNNELEFSVDNDTGRTVVKVVDRQTNELIKQIPDKQMLEIAKDLDKLIGLFVNNRA